METTLIYVVILLIPILLILVAFAWCLIMDTGHLALEKLRDSWLAGMGISKATTEREGGPIVGLY